MKDIIVNIDLLLFSENLMRMSVPCLLTGVLCE